MRWQWCMQDSFCFSLQKGDDAFFHYMLIHLFSNTLLHIFVMFSHYLSWSPQAPFIVNKKKQAFLQCNSSHLKIDIQNMTAESHLRSSLQSFTPVWNTVTCLDLAHRQLSCVNGKIKDNPTHPHPSLGFKAIMCVIAEIFLVDGKNAKLEEKIVSNFPHFCKSLNAPHYLYESLHFLNLCLFLFSFLGC